VARRKKWVGSLMLNKYRLSLGLFTLWWLYFFSLFLAQGSPVLVFFQQYARIVLWDIGVSVFFALCIVAGLMILAKGYLMKVILRWFVSLLVILSAIFNFPLIDGETGRYEAFGWYLSYPVLWILDMMFGGQAIAVKGFVIVLFVAILIWILYTLNFTLPKININFRVDDKPAPRKEEPRKATVERYYDESPKQHSTHEMGAPISASVIKTMLKQKVQEKIAEKEEKIRPVVSFSKDKPTFDISLMQTNVWQTATIDETFLMEKAKALQSKLMEFGVAIQIDGFDIGPSIVQLRIKPDAGIKLSSIESLKDDISSSLKTKSLRIIAPIPGTDTVWIQIPNPKPSMVRLGDVLGSADFAGHMKKSFTNLSLGKSVDGSTVFKTLESMPHLLVAGATGSGKSVWVNDFILSLIYQNTPSELKFLMVDPKQVELELYSGLPYLLWPIIHESEKGNQTAQMGSRTDGKKI
jgi:type IV secretory pathway VirB2 component (pilin)